MCVSTMCAEQLALEDRGRATARARRHARRGARGARPRRRWPAPPVSGSTRRSSSSTPTLRTEDLYPSSPRSRLQPVAPGLGWAGERGTDPADDARRRGRGPSGSPRSGSTSSTPGCSAAPGPTRSCGRPSGAPPGSARTQHLLEHRPRRLLGRRGRRRPRSGSSCRSCARRCGCSRRTPWCPARRASGSAGPLLAPALEHGRGSLRAMLNASNDPKAVRATTRRVSGCTRRCSCAARPTARRSRWSRRCARVAPATST